MATGKTRLGTDSLFSGDYNKRITYYECTYEYKDAELDAFVPGTTHETENRCLMMKEIEHCAWCW